MSRPGSAFPIVGVGASAGGVEALEGFFKGMPEDPGVAIVVVTHLNPEHESLLHEIIARYTKLTVKWRRMAPRLAPTAFMSFQLAPSWAFKLAAWLSRRSIQRSASANRSTSSSARWPRTRGNMRRASSCRAVTPMAL